MKTNDRQPNLSDETRQELAIWFCDMLDYTKRTPRFFLEAAKMLQNCSCPHDIDSVKELMEISIDRTMDGQETQLTRILLFLLSEIQERLEYAAVEAWEESND